MIQGWIQGPIQPLNSPRILICMNHLRRWFNMLNQLIGRQFTPLPYIYAIFHKYSNFIQIHPPSLPLSWLDYLLLHQRLMKAGEKKPPGCTACTWVPTKRAQAAKDTGSDSEDSGGKSKKKTCKTHGKKKQMTIAKTSDGGSDGEGDNHKLEVKWAPSVWYHWWYSETPVVGSSGVQPMTKVDWSTWYDC